MLSLSLRIFDRDGDKSVSRGEMKGIVENLFHLIAESRREDKSPKEVRKTPTAFLFGAHPKVLSSPPTFLFGLLSSFSP